MELGANIQVNLSSRAIVSAGVPQPPGSLRNPADNESVTKKFLALSEPVLGKQRAQKAVDVILSVEKMTKLRDLVEAVSSA